MENISGLEASFQQNNKNISTGEYLFFCEMKKIVVNLKTSVSVIVQPQYICLFSQDVSKNGQEVDTTKATQISDGQSGTSEEAEQKLLVSKKKPHKYFAFLSDIVWQI